MTSQRFSGVGTLVLLLLTAQRVRSFASPSPPSTVAVAGATGRTGSLVVKELLRRNSNVVAVVRDEDKAKRLFSESELNKLKIVACDFTNEQELQQALNGVDAAVWCASGFTSGPATASAPTSLLDKIKSKFFGGKTTADAEPKQSIDSIGIQAIAKFFNEKAPAVNGDSRNNKPLLPKLVMLSSAGVTRTVWDEAKKQQFIGAADIPIVRLNPAGILDIKRESEEKLRQSGTPYCIIRPCGLNDDWPAGSRPIFSQGDVACGRVNRADVAQVLVEALSLPEATGKTFEMVGLAGYQKADNIATALSRLSSDKEPLSKESVAASYAILQQLLPGEKQNSAALAIGQTYEQLDRGETGRFGERGKENVAAAGITQSK
ncbi:hypothetical protein MPSEU_000293200 [Mayamaea pseudoterrestris]|nr:hypothetical protein MPSEU_000293200 [Mayamaea pseudoterrestris]